MQRPTLTAQIGLTIAVSLLPVAIVVTLAVETVVAPLDNPVIIVLGAGASYIYAIAALGA